jgi:copper chaperone NosL
MRIMMIVCGLSLIAVIFLPIWRIDLVAPQYPEGLMMQIFADKVGGQVDIINGLNHYIGMKEIHNDDFIEFKILPYLIGLFSFLFILVGIFNRKKFFNFVFSLFVLFGILAMYDFWKWEYDYGHNLNPNAAIIVPGMSYQPPLIGFKQLLNFGAYSFPDVGGWIFIGVGALSLGCFVYLLRLNKKSV